MQCDGVAIGSSLGLLFANLFMSSFEEEVLPTLRSCLYNWERYVDDSNMYVVPEKVQIILNKLN